MYEPKYIKGFNHLVWKLRHILSNNPYVEQNKYFGVTEITEKYPQEEQDGILVEGKDVFGIEDYNFFSIRDIDFFFEQLNKRRDMGY